MTSWEAEMGWDGLEMIELDATEKMMMMCSVGYNISKYKPGQVVGLACLGVLGLRSSDGWTTSKWRKV